MHYYVYFILGVIFGCPGHPVELAWVDATMDGVVALLHMSLSGAPTPLVQEFYVDGVLTDALYKSKLADGQAEFYPNGSLTIHSYDDGDSGWYMYYSNHTAVEHRLITFSMYIL